VAKKGHKPASTKPAKPPTRARINARAATDIDFRRRALLNPGLRSKLDDKYLTPALATRRTAITEYNKPITEGSTVKTGDVTKAATSATDVEYGPLRQQYAESLGRAQNVQRDTGNFYDQYLQELRQHQTNVQSYQAGAQQALAQTAAGVTGLAGAQGAQLQQAANQQAAGQGVAQAGNLAPMASEAAAAQQQLMASYGAQQAGRGEAANEYASGRVAVGAGQKLSAQAQAAGKVTDVDKKIEALKREEGSYKQKYIETRRADEAKNVITQAIAQGKNVADLAKANITAAANTPAAKAAVAGATTAANTGAKYGYNPHQWALLGPKGRQAVISKFNKKSGGGGKGAGDHYGYTDEQWDKMSAEAKRKAYKDWQDAGRAGGKTGTTNPKTAAANDFRTKYGVDLQSTTQHNTARDQAANARTAFDQVGKVVKQADGKPHRVTTDDIVAALRTGSGVSKTSPLWIRVGLELKRSGTITPGTAARLHRAGYSVGTLGFKTVAAPGTGTTGAAGYNKGNRPG
jgi:hypothetical protein